MICAAYRSPRCRTGWSLLLADVLRTWETGLREKRVALEASDVQAGVVHSERPPDDAYGRVTNPDRFEPVVDAARRLVEQLSSDYQVTVDSRMGGFSIGSHDWGETDSETIDVTPGAGAPISIVFTSFPGVLIRFGEWEAQAFPPCGCDACDEDPDWVVERMRELVGSVVRGRFEEQLTRRSLRASFRGPWGDSTSEKRLDRSEGESYGQPGVRRWAEWPRRPSGKELGREHA
ncbi:MAG: DUF6226 family protein [Actinomycetota bacterium]